MKKLISLLLSMSIVLSAVPSIVFADGENNDSVSVWDGTGIDTEWDGQGTQESPYLITSAAELAGLASKTYNAVSTSTDVPVERADESDMYNAYTDTYFKLMCNVDLNNNEWLPIGRAGMRFNGHFDGNRHVVKNLRISKNYHAIGFFGATGRNVTVKNIGIDGAEIVYNSRGAAGDTVYDRDTSDDADSTWNISGIISTDRTNASGTLVGAVGGGTVEGCFAVNAEVNNTNSGARQPAAGGLIGAVLTTKQWQSSKPGGFTGSFVELNKDIVTTIKNSYVNNVKIAGCFARIGAFAGSCDNNSSGAVYRAGYVVNYCYAANVSMSEVAQNNDSKDVFFDFHHVSSETVKCYYENVDGDTNCANAVNAVKADLVNGISSLSGWEKDHSSEPINDGYPVLLWQKTWEDDTTEDVWDGESVDTEWSGNGTAQSPYKITSAAELAGLASVAYNSESTTDSIVSATGNDKIRNVYKGKYFKLTKNIDLDNKEWLPIGRHGMRFDANFDGGGHVIKNLKISEKNYFAMGLFGATGNDTVISNLGVDTANFTYSTVQTNGVAADYKSNGDITWSYPTYGPSDGYDNRTVQTGALVGMVSGGKFEKCFVKNVNITVTNTGMVQMSAGGLIGGALAVTQTDDSNKVYTYVNDCYVKGIEITGNIQKKAPLMGTATNNASDYKKNSLLNATNCYVADITGCNEVFCNTMNYSGSKAVNCFSTAEDNNTNQYCCNVTASATKEQITEGIAAKDGWKADNASSPINDGYPILLWQRGTAETPSPSPSASAAPAETPSPSPAVTAAPSPSPEPSEQFDTDWEGLGTAEKPYLITSADELKGLACMAFNAVSTSTDVPVSVSDNTETYNAYSGVNFKLMCDIDLKNEEWTPIGRVGMRFNGVFDGNNHVIKNIKMEKNYYGMGLFGATGTNVSIKNLGLDGVNYSYHSRTDGTTYDHMSKLGRTEATDITWSCPRDVSFSSTSRLDRTYGTGALIGLVSGGTVENCFARNVVIKNLESGANQQNIGGFIGASMATKEWQNGKGDAETISLNKKTTMTVTNCYVNNVEVGGTARFKSAFIGSASRYDSNYILRAAIKTINCYAGNITGENEAFCDSRMAIGTSASNTFTTSKAENNCMAVTVAEKALITESLTADGVGFTLDGTYFAKNGGMPILNWEAPWIYGTETDIVSKKMINILTDGQSKDHIFYNMNFVKTAEMDGINYEFDYLSQYTDLISNTGSVMRAKDVKKCSVKVYVHNKDNNTWTYETVEFTVMPRGVGIFKESFDDSISVWAQLGGVRTENSLSGYTGDKMLVLENGSATRPFTAYTDGTPNAVLSVYNDSDFESVNITFGSAAVSVSKSAIEVNGSSIDFTAPDGWFDIFVKADIDGGEVTVTVGDNSVSVDCDFTSVSAVTLQSASAKVDNLLVYESVPGELDALTEEIVLNGQSKFEVKSALNLPNKVDFHRGEIDILWESSDENVVKLDGSLGAVELTEKITLTAKAYDGSDLGEGEKPTDDDILQTKEFEVYVVPVGSSLVFADDFEAADTEGMNLSAYNDWTVNSTGKWVKYTIERDPNGNPLDDFGDSNKVMRQNRIVAGSSAADVESPGHSFDAVDADMLELSFDIYTTSLKNQPLFRIRTGNGDLMTEVYTSNSGGWLSNTTQVTNSRYIAFGFKPGNWQNHKYVVNTVNKTIAVYVDGVYKNTLRYTGSRDDISAIVFGSQRHSDPVGMIYFDNVTVRKIMPNDKLAVDTVAAELTLSDTANSDLTLATEGKFSTDIVWSSSNEDVINPNGSVTRQESDQSVTLTARVVKGESYKDREFTVKVPKADTVSATQAMLDSVAKNFLWSEVSDESQFAVTKNLKLVSSYNKGGAERFGGASVTWETSNSDAIAADGTVSRGASDKFTLLTATFAKDGKTAEKSFKVYVPQESVIETLCEDFDAYTVGRDVSDESDNWTDTAQNGGGNARIMYDGADTDNKVLNMKRRTSVDSPDMTFKYNVKKSSSDILVSVMFKLKSKFDTVKVDIGGIGHRIIVTQSGIKIADAELSKSLNLGEWYNVTLYYNTAEGVFDAYLDAERFTESSLKYDGGDTVDGITINDLSADRGDPSWYIDNITVRDISISDDIAAINAALREIELENTTIEWNIEDLPTAGRYGVSIEWISEKPEVLSSAGVVNRAEGKDYRFKFTARASRNGASVDKAFDVYVPAIPEGYKPSQQMFEKQMSDIPFGFYTDQNLNEITDDIALPNEYNTGNAAFYGGAYIEWTSDKPDVIDSTGKVIRPFFDEAVTLTAVYTSKRDPSIKTTVKYKVTVWAESEVMFREDFENVEASKEGTEIVDSDTRFSQEVRPQEQAQFARYRKDVADVSKPWAEANKVLAIERERGYDPDPERVYLNFPDPLTNMDTLAVSFDYMVDDTSVNGTVGFEEAIFKPTIQAGTFWSKGMRVESLKAKKWYTFTYVIMKSAGIVCVLRDGERVLNDYYYQQKGSQIAQMQFDIFRTNPPGKFYIDNIVVRNLSSSDEAAVKNALSGVNLGGGAITDDLVLSYTGIDRTLIGYKSSDTDVLSDDGKVTRPADRDRDVTFTASVSRGGYMASKTFSFTVKKGENTEYPYVINDITGDSSKKFSAVSIENKTGYTGNAHLLITARDKSEVVETRCIPLTAAASGSVTFDEIDMSDIEYYSIEAYIVSGNRTLSGTKTVKY